MGKQRRHQKHSGTERIPSTNSVNWDTVAQQLYKAGLIGATALGTEQPYAADKDSGR